MVYLSEATRSLFYNPEDDSLDNLINSIKGAHREILSITDTKQGTLKTAQKSGSPESFFRIPVNGVHVEEMPSLIAGLFRGVARWHSPRVMYNVAPSPVLPAVTGKLFTALYNPNLVMASASGVSLDTEQRVVEAVAEYVGWSRSDAGGVFTFGGKATTMYGIRAGLKKAIPNFGTEGVDSDVVVFSTQAGHPSHISDAGWMGIGADNVRRLKTDHQGRIDLDTLERALVDSIKEGKKIGAIILSGGSTNNMVVDPIKDVVGLRDRIKDSLQLDYTPHIHVDAVVGFPWIFFKNYNFEDNYLSISDAAAGRIRRVVKDLQYLGAADSFGIDFHKMGFCPYISSLYMTKDGSTLGDMQNATKSPFTYTIENSRPGDGPNSAYIALNTLGERGFQEIIAYLTETAIDLQEKLISSGDFDVVNRDSLGISVMFRPRMNSIGMTEGGGVDVRVKDAYTLRFIDRLTAQGNPYYIDKVPGGSTGANPYPYVSLKAYIMSPFANAATNDEFISYIRTLKEEIDEEFRLMKSFNLDLGLDFAHPLK